MYRSPAFQPVEVNGAYATLREKVVSDYRAKTGSTNQVRVPANLIYLVDAEQGVTICQGLSNGIWHAEHHTGELRWEIRTSF